jgi:hypothetical protein
MSDFDQIDPLSGYELTLIEAVKKNKAEQLLFAIFHELDINESKLKATSYGVEKLTDLVHKLIVRFNDENSSALFYNFAQNENNQQKYGFCNVIKSNDNHENILELNDKPNNSDLSDSILVINQDEPFLNCKSLAFCF